MYENSTAVVVSESRPQINQRFCPCSATQKAQSNKNCLHGTYCCVIWDLTLFSLFIRQLWNWEWPFSHGLQMGHGGSMAGAKGKIHKWRQKSWSVKACLTPVVAGRPQPGARDLKAKGGPAWRRDSQWSALEAARKRNCLNSALSFPAEGWKSTPYSRTWLSTLYL